MLVLLLGEQRQTRDRRRGPVFLARRSAGATVVLLGGGIEDEVEGEADGDA